MFSVAIVSEAIALVLLVWLVEEPRKRRTLQTVRAHEAVPEPFLAPEAVVLASDEDVPDSSKTREVFPCRQF